MKIADGVGGFTGGPLPVNNAFGRSTTNIGDLNGDGIPELAVGAFNDTSGGALYILFLKADGTVKSQTKIASDTSGLGTLANGDSFGMSSAALGDFNGDGIPDIAVGAPGDDTGGSGRGAIYILSLNTNGTVKSQEKIADNTGGFGTLVDGDSFGNSCASLGDLDGDGISDLAIGANVEDTGGSGRGAVFIAFLNADGTVKSQTKLAHNTNGLGSLADGDNFGFSCANLGDLNGDGIPELGVGAHQDATGGTRRGALYVLFLDTDGTVESQTKIADNTSGFGTLVDFDVFGSSCTSLGDLDGDGIPEVGVGALDDGTGGLGRGALYVLFLNTDGKVRAQNKIASDPVDFDALADYDSFGSSCAALGDLDGDCIPEIAVGATRIDTPVNNNQGGLFILSIGDPPITVTTLEDEDDATSTDGTGISLREAVSDAEDAGEFRTINFDPSLNGKTIVLGGMEIPIIDQDVKVTGKGLSKGIAISGNNQSRIFHIQGTSQATLECLEILDGYDDSFSGGGVIVTNSNTRAVIDQCYIHDCSTDAGGGGAVVCNTKLFVRNSTFQNNAGPLGGALLSAGIASDLTVENSTFVGNMSITMGAADGAAIANISDATSTVKRSTFISNTAEKASSYTVYSASGPIHVENCAFADSETSVGVESSGSFTESDNFDLALSDFADLGYYGEKTLTQPLLPDSTAKNMAAYTPLPITDQNGFSRIRNGGPDPGAAEAIETTDYQPDNLIGEKRGKQKGNNIYNTTGAGQKVKVKLQGRKKFKTFMTVQNDGEVPDTITLRSNKPNKRTLKLKVRQIGGGNVTAVLRTGLTLPTLAPGQSVSFKADYKRKSKTKKARGKLRFTSTSSLFGKADTAMAKIKSLRD